MGKMTYSAGNCWCPLCKKKLCTHRIKKLFTNCANNGGLSKKEGFIYDMCWLMISFLFKHIRYYHKKICISSLLVYPQCQTFGKHHCQLSGPPAGQVRHWWSLIISNFEKRHYWPTCATRRIDTLCPLKQAESLLTCKYLDLWMSRTRSTNLTLFHQGR